MKPFINYKYRIIAVLVLIYIIVLLYFIIKSPSPVRYTVFCFWTGTNPMSENRKACLRTIPYCRFVTKDNLSDFILPSVPLHESYSYLSETHKADYLRTYFMHHYGGGYSDIKEYSPDSIYEWRNAFNRLYSDLNIWAIGYGEESPGSIAHPDYQQHYRSMIGNGAYVCRPNTPLTREWYNQMITFLDSVLSSLRKNPSNGPQDCAEKGTGYPIEWNQMLGRIFHPLVYKYRDHIRTEGPRPVFEKPYR